MTEIFPKVRKETDTQVQEALTVLNKINSNRSTSRYITIKMVKVKDRFFKNSKRSTSYHMEGELISLSVETMQARRE